MWLECVYNILIGGAIPLPSFPPQHIITNEIPHVDVSVMEEPHNKRRCVVISRVKENFDVKNAELKTYAYLLIV